MLENIKESLLESLHKLRLNLSHLWYLEQAVEGVEVEDNPVIKALERKGYLIEGKVTESGKIVYEQFKCINLGNDVSIDRNPDNADIKLQFQKWWAIFPRTDKFTFNGSTMYGGRTLRKSEGACYELFRKMVLKGDYTGDQIVKATIKDITNKMENSIQTGKNQLTFTNNSETYLRQKAFEAWIEEEDRIEDLTLEI